MMWSVIIVQWVAIALLALLVVGLMREVGLLQLKVGPPGAMRTGQGVPVGSRLDPRPIRDWTGTESLLPLPGVANLVAFLSPTCGVCHQLIDPIRIVAKHERELAVSVVCQGDEQECREFLGEMGAVHVIPDPGGPFKESLGITSSSFGQVFDSDGVAGPSGIVNNLSHLESLFQSFDADGRLVLEGEPQEEPQATRPVIAQEV